MSSELRSVLTRSLGQNPIVQVDFAKSPLYEPRLHVLCSDGLHSLFMEHEIADVVTRMAPAGLRILHHDSGKPRRRGQYFGPGRSRRRSSADGLLSRACRLYPDEKPETLGSVTTEIEAGQVLDDRFEIIEAIHRSGDEHGFQGTGPQRPSISSH